MIPGTLIAGKYRASRVLGEGAMGVVWAAVNERTEREVALKLINGENEKLRRRLLREARACGRLVHRNIIEILDVGETESGDPFLIMPLLSGETLAERLKRDGLLPPPLAARIAADIARGLAAAHEAGIVHRDLKPANVFLHHEPGSDDDFVVKVLDFGVSKMAGPGDPTTATMTGGAVGSPLYMSPEQAIGDANVGPRADIWAVGVLLFEMLTGTRPFYASSAFAVVAKILRGPIPTVVERAPGVDPALGAVVARCLVRRPVDRLASAADLAALLEPFAGAREHPTLPPPLPEPVDDEEEPTNFFRRPRNNAAADEMMAAAHMLNNPEPLSSGEILSSSEVLSSADLVASGPAADGATTLPDGPPSASSAEAGASPPSNGPSSSTTPLIQPEEAGDDDLAPWAKPSRTGLWLTLAGLAALAVAIALYVGSRSEPSAPARPAATASASAPRPQVTIVAPAISASPTPPPPPPSSAAPAPKAGDTPAPPAASTAATTTPPRPTGQARPPAGTPVPPPPRTGGKIIRETPF